MTDHNHTHLNDAALESLAGEIDRLAFSDRGDVGLEARIYAATLPLLQQAPAAQPTLRLVGEVGETVTSSRVTRRRKPWTLTPMRIAAGFALVATAALTWMATRPAVIQPVKTNVLAASNPGEEWAILSTVFDDGTRTELDDLFDATTSLRSSINSMGVGELLEEGEM